MDEIIFRLDEFEGPMDLLLEIIRKNKYKITDIPISEICDQDLAYMEEAERQDASEANGDEDGEYSPQNSPYPEEDI